MGSEKGTTGLPPLSDKVLLTPEFRLVVACSWLPTGEHGDRQSATIKRLCADPLDWKQVVALVQRHGLQGVAYVALGHHAQELVPSDILEQLKEMKVQNTVGALRQVAELGRIGREFASAGIELIPLKGVALSQLLYGDPTIRSSGDIDLLVKKECLERSDQLLVNNGYRNSFEFYQLTARQQRHIMEASHHIEYEHENTVIHLELHWRNFLWTPEQSARLWATCRPFKWLNGEFLQLADQELLFFLCEHGARHRWLMLKWLSDVATMFSRLPEKEWQNIFDEAEKLGMQRVLAHTAVLLHWLYAIEPPHSLLNRINNTPAIMLLAKDAITYLQASFADLANPGRRGQAIWMIPHYKRLLPMVSYRTLVNAIMVSSADFALIPLPDNLFWLYPIMRPLAWFWRNYIRKPAQHK